MSTDHNRHSETALFAAQRLSLLKRNLTFQLYRRHGAFWSLIKDVRTRWRIVPKCEIPPSTKAPFLPDYAPLLDRNDVDSSRRYWGFVGLWHRELDKVAEQIPKISPIFDARPVYWQVQDFWRIFLSSCALFDPPETQLLEYATPNDPKDFNSWRVTVDFKSSDKTLSLIAAPVMSLQELSEAKDWYWERILKYIEEEYLLPNDMDLETLLLHIPDLIPGFTDERYKVFDEQSRQLYIRVDPETSRKNVDKAFNAIRKVQPFKESRTSRDELTAVQCAILYDRHNSRDLNDKRKRRWTYARLADQFDLGTDDTARNYVLDGRRLLMQEG